MPDIEWKSRVRLVDEIVDVIRGRIYAGEYLPGAPIRQEQVAAELNVSRTPLREALRMLEQEGLVTVSPGRGVRVVSGNVDQLLDAYELREVIDGLAARLVAERKTPATESALQVILDGQQRVLDNWNPAAYTETNVRFHEEIVRGAENQFVSDQISIIRITSQVFTPVKLVEWHRAADATREHLEILESIVSGCADDAERRARKHIRRTIESLVEARERARALIGA
jgi:DNA-binding GntR family transcriptional regulator